MKSFTFQIGLLDGKNLFSFLFADQEKRSSLFKPVGLYFVFVDRVLGWKAMRQLAKARELCLKIGSFRYTSVIIIIILAQVAEDEEWLSVFSLSNGMLPF